MVACYNRSMKLLLWMTFITLELLATPWHLEKEDNGITVYTREVNGSDYLEFKGIVEVNASVDAVVAFLYDTQRTPEWIHDCDFGMTLEEVHFRDNYIYQTFDLPFPVSNRALILHSTLTYTSEGARLDSAAASDFCKEQQTDRCQRVVQNRMLMITKSKGSYRLIKRGATHTKIIWQLHTEPGGYIPTWLANALVVDLPFYSLAKLREMVLEARYYKMTRKELERLWVEQYKEFH